MTTAVKLGFGSCDLEWPGASTKANAQLNVSKSYASTIATFVPVETVKMASAGTGKQATVYIIDVGKDMGAKHNSRTETDLEYGMRYVWDKVAGVMSANRATWLVGVTGLRTDETQNACADNPDLEGYDNICQWKTLGSCGMNDVRNLQPKIVPSRTVEGDTMSAIALAVQEITEATMLKTGKPGKFDRKIVLLTNGRGYIDPDGLDEHLDEIAKKINAVDMQLSIM